MLEYCKLLLSIKEKKTKDIIIGGRKISGMKEYDWSNILMMVQVGLPTGVCVVRSRLENHGKGREINK